MLSTLVQEFELELPGCSVVARCCQRLSGCGCLSLFASSRTGAVHQRVDRSHPGLAWTVDYLRASEEYWLLERREQL